MPTRPRLLPLSAALLSLLIGSCQSQTDSGRKTPTATGSDQWVGTGAQRLHTETYRSPQRSAHPTLLVVLHGDAPFTKPDYQYRLAQQLAQANADVVAVGLLRPGYTDPQGH